MKGLRISVTITEYGKSHKLNAETGKRLKEILDREGIKYSLPCGGSKGCGKCKVRFLKGAPNADFYEEDVLSDEERADGVRLLCRCILNEDCELDLGQQVLEKDMSIATLEYRAEEQAGQNKSSTAESDSRTSHINTSVSYGIAVDLGTTTIAAALIRCDDSLSGEDEGCSIIRTASCVNSQRKYGADVISRIAAAEDETILKELSALAVSDIGSLVKELTAAEGISFKGDSPDLKAITITGNTTMLNLLAKRNVSGLGKYPYTSNFLDLEQMPSETIMPDIPGINLTLMPGISGFVGADIVSGLFSLAPNPSEKFFFLDLGTNGEMAFYDGKVMNVTSTAAGPVFEAGGISAGAPSVPGAISHVSIDPGARKVTYETIGGKAPIGICGTGVMEIVSELYGNGIIDDTGLLTEKFFEEGFPVTEDGSIRFTQGDIRNVQLAKAAILTGAKALLQGKEPDRVYIAGGFGSNISQENISNLKMFPKAFDGKIVAVGNSALKGAALFTTKVLSGEKALEDAAEELERIARSAKVTQLAELDSFDEDYIEAMNFGLGEDFE